MLTLTEPTERKISLRIPPNYSSWQTIELSYQCAKYCVDNGIPGDFVECGVATGNNLAAMCLAGRHGYGFDSFDGIPWAGPNDAEQPGLREKDESKSGLLESSGVTVHSREDCAKNMKSFGVNNFTLTKGWFQHTLHYFVKPISVLRLDGDLYASTLVSLKNFYYQLSPGGILIVDDWNLIGCRKACIDWFMRHGKPRLVYENGPAYFQKTA